MSDEYICDNIHSKLEQKKPANYIVNFRYISEVMMMMMIYIYDKMHSKLEQKMPRKYIVNFRCISEVYTLSWNKKRLQNISEIFDMVHMSQVGNLAEVSRDFRDIISRSNTKVTASMSPLCSRPLVSRHLFCSGDYVTKVT